MPDTALTTRITEETARRLYLAKATHRRTIQQLVEDALVMFLTVLEASEAGGPVRVGFIIPKELAASDAGD